MVISWLLLCHSGLKSKFLPPNIMDIIKNIKEMREFHQSIVFGYSQELKDAEMSEEMAFNHRSRTYIHEDFVKTCDKVISAIDGKSE